MEIETLPVDQLIPAPYNPRVDLTPGHPEYEKLKRSLDEFGCVEPLVWNRRSGFLVGGHQRLAVLKAQGAVEAQVSVVDLPPEKERALNLALNRIRGEWDRDKLATLLDELCKLDGFDVALTGFDAEEVSIHLDRLVSMGEDNLDLDKELAAAGETPVTIRGELLELGPHRLLCGDSSLAENHERLLGGQTVDLLFTDPPYNVDYYGGSKPKGKGVRPKPTRQWRQIYMDNLPEEKYREWLAGVLGLAFGRLAPGGAFYIWNGFRQFGPMDQMVAGLGGHVACVITWAKESIAFSYGDYHQQTEFCLYGWKEGGPHEWFGPGNESTLWNVHRVPTASYQHPTQKPLELAQRAMRNSSARGATVLDCFGGSGTTLVAAETLGRAARAIELDPVYCDVIVRRWIREAGAENVPAALRDRYRLEAVQ